MPLSWPHAPNPGNSAAIRTLSRLTRTRTTRRTPESTAASAGIRSSPPAELLTPCDPAPLMAYPVDRRVNKPSEDDASLLAPLGESGLLG
ncbi:hypothetical protein [uncultured Thiocystis sp.]|uniref:hypothetical protein n=1 Tax=uncultured Thiocystis sp. TaxID=1202134 RepID=UPI0025D267BF|nr:hypothetical protein [uncultured Thiocystis sp.]